MRLYTITVIVELHRIKNYKEETLYLACSLTDRYLARLTALNKPSPCLIRLAFVCTLMAAKLEEPMQPSFNRMVRLVAKEWNFTTTRQELIELESEVIRELDWDLVRPGPLFFLERFQRVFFLDQERSDVAAACVGSVARRLMRCMLLRSCSLRFKPSQIAATSLLLSIGILKSPCAVHMGVQQLPEALFE